MPFVVLLTVAGTQVPVIPLLERAGNVGAVAPLQIADGRVNKGVTVVLTTLIVVVAADAHCPDVGVNVYVPVIVLSTVAGDQVPFTLLSEVPGRITVEAP